MLLLLPKNVVKLQNITNLLSGNERAAVMQQPLAQTGRLHLSAITATATQREWQTQWQSTSNHWPISAEHGTSAVHLSFNYVTQQHLHWFDHMWQLDADFIPMTGLRCLHPTDDMPQEILYLSAWRVLFGQLMQWNGDCIKPGISVQAFSFVGDWKGHGPIIYRDQRVQLKHFYHIWVRNWEMETQRAPLSAPQSHAFMVYTVQ